MKIKLIVFFLFLGIFFITLFYKLTYNNDYLIYKSRKCIVLDKLESEGSYKRFSYFYLILKEERGILFDLIVSPSTYSQSNKGDIVYFNLRQKDIKQTSKEDWLNIIGIIFGGLCIVCFIMGVIVLTIKNENE